MFCVKIVKLTLFLKFVENEICKALELFFFSTDHVKAIFNFGGRSFARIGFP